MSLRTSLALALAAAACLAAPAQAAPAAPASATRIDLTSKAYQAAFGEYTKAGMKLLSVSGYTVKGKVRYAATWRAQEGPDRVARHGLSAGALKLENEQLGKAGYKPVFLRGFEAGGKERYVGIWEQRPDVAVIARVAQSQAAFDGSFAAMVKQGWRLRHVDAFTVGGLQRFTGIYEKSAGPEWVTHTRMTPGDYQAKYNAYVKQGLRLRTVRGYERQGKRRYAALWEKAGGPAMRARHGIDRSRFGRVFESDRRAGWYPVAIDVDGSEVSLISESAFSRADLAKLDAAAASGMAGGPTSGLSVAIAKEGRLLYAAGFGEADRARKTRMDALHRIRIGSTSKAVTSATIHRLIALEAIPSIDTRVFGPGGLLASVPLPSAMKPLEGATIGQFLSHTSGLRGDVGDPVDCAKGGLPNRIAAELARYAKERAAAGSSPLLGAPGQFRQYSNVSNIIAEAVIERVTGKPYERIVRSQVFAPAGIRSARLFRIGAYDPASGEAKHYERGAAATEHHEWPANRTCEDEPPGVGAGGWAMTAYDLARFLVHHDGRPQRELLPPVVRAAMVAPVAPAMNAGDLGYARSWQTSDWRWCGMDRNIVQGHNGWLPGGWSDAYELDDGFQVVVISNQNGTDGGSSCERQATRRFIEVTQQIDWPEHDLFG